jgi:hypothetical protein
MKAGRRGLGMTGREKEPCFGLAPEVFGYRAAESTTTLLPNEPAASFGVAVPIYAAKEKSRLNVAPSPTLQRREFSRIASYASFDRVAEGYFMRPFFVSAI